MPSDLVLVGRLGAFVRPFALLVGIVLLTVLGITALDAAAPWIVGRAVDDAIVVRQPDKLLQFAALYLLVQLALFGLRYTQEQLVNTVGQGTMHDVRVAVFAHLQSLSMDYFESRSVGEVMAGLTNDIDALNQLLTVGGLTLIFDLTTIAGTALAMLLLDWRLGAGLLVLVPVMAVVTMRIRGGIRAALRIGRRRLSHFYGLLEEGILQMPTIQLFNQQHAYYVQFEDANRDLLAAYLGELRYSSWFGPLISGAAAVGSAVVIWYGARALDAGEVSIGVLVAFLQYVGQLFDPLQRIGNTYNTAQQALTACERIFETLDTQPTVRAPATPTLLPQARGDLELRNVWFAYEPDRWVLKGVSLRVEPGEHIAIVGRTGAGKTSLISLIPRLYDVARGAVLLDGVDVRQLALHQLRRQIGVVPQHPVLLSRSVLDNIRLNDATLSDAQIRVALAAVGADAVVDQLPRGLATLLGEGGAGLSTGQRQLLVFARALVFDPRVLILDEATAGVDAATDQFIQQALATLLMGRTSITIAHRLASIRDVDRIVVVDHGEIVEDGQHFALLRAGGLYARLYALQEAQAPDPLTTPIAGFPK